LEKVFINQSPEQRMKAECLVVNHEKIDDYFGAFFGFIRSLLASNGSELGLGMTLVSLVMSTKSIRIFEIGRFKGFSTIVWN
jgi:hypothetical protein